MSIPDLTAEMTEPLPSLDEMRHSALEWAMNRRGGYTGSDLKEYLTEHFKLTEEQLARAKEGQPRWENRVEVVTAEFTKTHIHAGWNGYRAGSGRSDLYFLTRYGYAIGEGKAEWPTDRRRGPASAKPDPRQLNEAQLRRATWITPRELATPGEP